MSPQLFGLWICWSSCVILRVLILFYFFTNANIIEIFPIRICQFSGNYYGQIIAPCDKPLCQSLYTVYDMSLEKGCMIWQKKKKNQLNLSISILIKEYDSRLGWQPLMTYFADRIKMCKPLPYHWHVISFVNSFLSFGGKHVHVQHFNIKYCCAKQTGCDVTLLPVHCHCWPLFIFYTVLSFAGTWCNTTVFLFCTGIDLKNNANSSFL